MMELDSTHVASCTLCLGQEPYELHDAANCLQALADGTTERQELLPVWGCTS